MRIFLFLSLLAPLFWGACSNPRSSAIRQLEENQYRFTAEDFLFAASAGDVSTLILFGKAGINVNSTDSMGHTALMEASRKGKIEAVDILLRVGADPRLVDSQGRDALIATAGGGYTEIGRLLLSRGADATIRDTAGWTALSLAAFKGEAEMVRLLAGQAAQEKLDEALLLASFSGNKETVSNLLSQGACIETKSPENFTPLMIAAQKGNIEVAGLLLQNRANHQSIDLNGRSASQLAKDAGHPEIVKMIAGERPGPKINLVGNQKAEKQQPGITPRKQGEKPFVALNGSTIRSRRSEVGILSAFELSGYEERELPVSLKDVDGVYAIITRLDPTGIATDVKIAKGELIPGTEYRLREIESRKVRSNGLPETTIDTARVRIQNTRTGANHLLVKAGTGLPEAGRSVDTHAILSSTSSNYRYVVKTGDIFQTIDPDFGERDFQVVALRPSEVSLKELASEKVHQVKRKGNL